MSQNFIELSFDEQINVSSAISEVEQQERNLAEYLAGIAKRYSKYDPDDLVVHSDNPKSVLKVLSTHAVINCRLPLQVEIHYRVSHESGKQPNLYPIEPNVFVLMESSLSFHETFSETLKTA